jgi:hypothetical protein
VVSLFIIDTIHAKMLFRGNIDEQICTCAGNELLVGGLPLRLGATYSLVFSKIQTLASNLDAAPVKHQGQL